MRGFKGIQLASLWQVCPASHSSSPSAVLLIALRGAAEWAQMSMGVGMEWCSAESPKGRFLTLLSSFLDPTAPTHHQRRFKKRGGVLLLQAQEGKDSRG